MTSIPKKPLELTVYQWVDRWVDYTMEFAGETVKGSSREMGYETPHGVWRGDEFPEKRLTDAELAAEAWAAQCNRRVRNYDPTQDIPGVTWEWEHNIMARFATLPHYDEAAL